MRYSFSELQQNILTRKFGGTTVGVATPYLTGTHFIWFDKLPEALPTHTKDHGANLDNLPDIRNVLAATCLSVTPPGGTLNRVEFPGLGGTKWSVPGNVDYGNSVSVKFVEMSKLPILDIMHGWIKLMRDYRTGLSDLQDDEEGTGFTKKAYAGLMYYWTTAADGKTVEYYACYDGVFPTKDPQDLYASDIETIGRLDVEIEFNVDYAWHESWVKTKCQSFSDDLYASVKGEVQGYGQKQGGS